jgi:UDPglucose 6-dehydrogenase
LLPSRIIIGGDITHQAKIFADLITESTSNKKSLETLFMGSSEAESVKLFSNSYLALRVVFFNELDNFSIHNNLNSEEIIRGVSLDKRIGNFYNNPSFGYSGYCLPKDTKQLLSNFKKIPQKIISAIVESNEIRKNYIVEDILSRKPRQIGCYRIIMKANSDNFRDSSILDIIKKLRKNDVKIKIFEPLIEDDLYEDFIIEHDINRFKKDSELIILNRIDSILDDVSHKIYSRDIFNID